MPGAFKFIFKWLVNFNYNEAVIGDLEEMYYEIRKEKKRIRSFFWLVWQVLLIIPDYYINSIYRSMDMIKSYIKTGFRNIKKEKLLSSILVIGLIVGISTVTLISIYLSFKLSYDEFHRDANKIYRVLNQEKQTSKVVELSLDSFNEVFSRVPGVEATTKLFRMEAVSNIRVNNRIYKVELPFFADSGFFKVFSFELIYGRKTINLDGSDDVLITKSTALKIWNRENVVGERISYFNKDYYIKGVLNDIPANSHLKFNILFSMSSQKELFSQIKGNEYYNYLRLKKNSQDDFVLKQVRQAGLNEFAPRIAKFNLSPIDIKFQQLPETHLNSAEFEFKIAEHGNKNLIKILITMVICIAVIMFMNFINLLTSKFQKRLKEVGIRKVLGADNNSLLIQFICESVILAIISSLVSIFIVLSLLNPFSNLFNVDLTGYFTKIHFIIGFIFLLGIVAGILSAIFPTLTILRNKNAAGFFERGKAISREKIMYGSVILQLSVVAGLLVVINVTNHQVNYLKNSDTGFKKEGIIVIENINNLNFETVKNELEKIHGINKVGGSGTLPGRAHSGMSLARLGSKNKKPAFENRIQKDFIETMGIKLIAGRTFIGNAEIEKDNIILNETAVKILGYTSASIINEKVEHFLGVKTVIGVVKDFNYFSFHSKIDPLILSCYSPRNYWFIVRTGSQKDNLIPQIKHALKNINTNAEFEFSFLKDNLDQLYIADEKENDLIFYTTLISIILSLAGLTALTSYIVMYKSKEIGVRKVLGASTRSILFLLYEDFFKFVLLSNIIVWPLVWFFVTDWLSSYPYHIDISVVYFVDSFVVSLFIVILTVSYLTIKAALKNPLMTIKYE